MKKNSSSSKKLNNHSITNNSPEIHSEPSAASSIAAASSSSLSSFSSSSSSATVATPFSYSFLFLQDKIKSHTATIGIIGLGYVGLPLVIRFGEEGFPVIGFDVDTQKIERLRAAKSYIKHIPAGKIGNLVSQKNFRLLQITPGSKKQMQLLFVSPPL